MNKAIAAFFVSMVVALPVSAQQSDWSWRASVYGWVPSLDTTIETSFGTVDAGLSQSDVLSSLDMAAMFALEARKGRWSLIADVFHSDLSGSQSTPFGALFSEAKVNTKLSFIGIGAAYRAYDTDAVAVDVGAGLRAYKMDIGLTLAAGSLPTQSSTSGKTWVDPIVMARVIVPFNDRWSALAYVDFGGTGSDDKTWQALASVTYQFNDRWSARFGYRALDLENVIGGRATTLNLSGPFIAASYDF